MKLNRKFWIIPGVAAMLLACQKPLRQAIKTGRFSKGNAEKYSVRNTPAENGGVLRGKIILFLGSSVTFGSQSLGSSFVEYLEKRDGIIPVKEAVSGTTLVDNGPDSYIQRMKTMDPSLQADAFVCQLSTNDAVRDLPLGEIGEGMDMDAFDTGTVTGAIEYIIAYARRTWNCPVVFYTGTRFDNEKYKAMVAWLLELQEKWGIGIIDLWNDEEMNAVSQDDYKLYMFDGVHPTRAGYREWWTPKFESYFKKLWADEG